MANGVLFAAYDPCRGRSRPRCSTTLIIACAAKRCGSVLIGIAVHNSQRVVILAVTLSLVLGLGPAAPESPERVPGGP